MHWTDELFDGPYDREYEGKTAGDIERATREILSFESAPPDYRHHCGNI